ncbi:aldose epimerase family protein [Oenococcus kitaharae]|uniref:Aldose 1-epimerase n=1 Tax=Oenococcus kitaharae DSM 17330 TaxID=1045004 RepID=G9WEW6_9LACO|nr:aldose epimerase family protein [Oenococcus kitaharae]EHN58289.1 Aldose 1-epimerase [Oenococcus kitaharae DSM 17330]OEY81533.1 aldose epimerase [Oenococcus kitaharae]OEY83020.1 aldose epimerase [Oenococcus kitaharae]OEY84435.1 aldose epimerase [Oenococcus kitaharae]
MIFRQDAFGRYGKQKVTRYTLVNQHGTKISVLNYAGILQEFSVLDDGKRQQLLLKSDDLSNYTDNDLYLNHIVGRTAGRIKDASFKLNGQDVSLLENENGNSLHGGPQGFSFQFFQVDQADDRGKIVLSKQMTAAEDGFPGDLLLTVSYELSEDDRLTVTFTGQQTGTDGVFNPTLHTYFNLADDEVGDITGHDLWLNSHQHLAFDASKAPDGRLIDNQGPFDLKNQPDLGKALEQLKKMTAEGGFDDVFLLDQAHRVDTDPAAVITDRSSGRQVRLYSTRNAIVAYSADAIDRALTFNHGAAHPWTAMALEAQTAPNSENIPSLGDVVIRAGSTQTVSIDYQYRHL